jgi:hypothetical protein
MISFDLDAKSWSSLGPILVVGAAAVLAIVFITGLERYVNSQPVAAPAPEPAPSAGIAISPAGDATQLAGPVLQTSPFSW